MTPEDDPVALGSDRNVTTQGEEAEAPRRERDLLSALLDTAGALVVVLDHRGRIVRFNRACETTTGYSFEEVSGRALWDFLLAPEEIEPVRTVFEPLRAGQSPNEYENHWLTKDGARWLIGWPGAALLGGGETDSMMTSGGYDVCQGPEGSNRSGAFALERLKRGP